MNWADAWQRLLISHTPFRGSETDDFQELLRQLSELERLFIEHPRLHPYYAGCMRLPTPSDATPLTRGETANVAAMQMQLMEDAYFSLRLGHYANAPDNRGWMNLFRSWSRSSAFHSHFLELQRAYARRFVDFYTRYIDGWGDIDEEPAPHPWDVSPDLPEHERAPETDLLAEEIQIGRTFVDMVQAFADIEEAEGARLRRVPFYRPMGLPIAAAKYRGISGVYLDRGRREAGTPTGDARANPQAEAPAIAGEHGETESSPGRDAGA